MSKAAKDQRVERTRQALLGAFVQLMLEGRRYDRITIADLIERAGVGRSTFYEHYRNKHEVLEETIRYPFAPLARAVDTDFDVVQLRGALTHFLKNRVHARAIFAGAMRARVSCILAAMIEERLRLRAKGNGIASPASFGIAAVALAEGQLAAIVSWLGGAIVQDEPPLAQTLYRIAQATAREMCGC